MQDERILLMRECPLQHRLHIVSNLERRFGLRLDLVDGDTVSQFNEGQAVGEVNVEHAELGDDTTDTSSTG